MLEFFAARVAGLPALGSRFEVRLMVFFVPPVASVVLFAFVCWADVLPQPQIVGAFVLLGVVAEFLAPRFSAVWFAASLLNIGLAIYFAIRLKFGLW